MKKILNLLFIIASIFCFSQKYIDGIIIKKDNDTINSKIRISTNIFNKKIIDERSFYDFLVLVDESGEKKEIIKTRNVKELRFTDFNGKDRIYIDDKGTFRQLMFSGEKTKWFRDIVVNSYDGSITYADYLVYKDGQELKIGGGFTNTKKMLIKATAAKPELENQIKIMERFSDEYIVNLLKNMTNNLYLS
ncbi:hypothetical protein [Chryseobacterium sp. MEBOG07]|uniref:hypothetical protein n=1 Tax=Chryseobacterium sp. MEBOG07 TaxID=2879939 RepID=UPI001F205677|nr:hypothetical protein [Chryseobacterium sp. MEBOG07]UKB78951.1 hypothetical protein LF886_21330 [Chryseobacterium sp. MEBOG07]